MKTPNFSKFDRETKEEKEAAILTFKKSQKIRDKIHDFFRPILKAIIFLLCICYLSVL